jgi:hypothetical protein
MFTGHIGMKAPRKGSYFLTRSISDLWLWWALIHTVSYLVTSVPRTLFGTSGIATIITGIIALVMEIWVLDRYLSDLNWQQWVVVNIVGGVLVLVVAVLPSILLRTILGSAAQEGTLQVQLYNVSTAILSALIISLAQWRVLTHYVRGYGASPWIVANIVSSVIGTLSLSVASELTADKYVHIAGDALSALIGSLIVGYTLMQILRPYAPAAAPV